MEKQKSIKNILVIRLSSLGDVLLTTPVIRALKKKHPDSEIDFLVKPQFSDVLKFNPYIKELILYNTNDVKGTIKKLKEKKYDLCVDLQNNLRSKKIRRKLKTEEAVFTKPTFEKFMLVHFKKNYFGGIFPIPFRYAQAVKNLTLDGKGLDLFLPEKIETAIEPSKKRIGFCPGAKHFTKRYPPEYYSELGRLLSEAGFEIVIFGGKDDLNICNEVAKEIPGSINLCNSNELFKTAANIKLCTAVVCNDSGLMHVASAVGTPVIAIFGSTVKEFGFVPFGVKNIILENNNLTCRPCTHIGRAECKKGHFDCMRKLTPKFVFEETVKFLKEL